MVVGITAWIVFVFSATRTSSSNRGLPVIRAVAGEGCADAGMTYEKLVAASDDIGVFVRPATAAVGTLHLKK
jgi:hypothetical protein